MTSNFQPDQLMLDEDELETLKVLSKNVHEQKESDTTQTKALLRYVFCKRMDKHGFTGLEVKEDWECQLVIRGQVITLVVDVAVFWNGKPFVIGVVYPDLDAVTRDELAEHTTWRLMAAYAHSGWTVPLKIAAVMSDKKKHLMCTSTIDREMVDQAAQVGLEVIYEERDLPLV